MIHESYYWKNQLKKDLYLFNKLLKTRKKWSNNLHNDIERFVNVTSYSVRKLFDSYKISDEVESEKIIVKKYPRSSVKRKWYLVHDFDPDFYDFSTFTEVRITFRQIANMIIHSYDLFIMTDGSYNISGLKLLFNSDKYKDDAIFELNLTEYLKYLNSIINDHVVSTQASYDQNTQKLIYKKSNTITEKN